MLPYPLRWASIATILLLVCFTQAAETTVISLLDLMPKCASQCIESFISAEYPRNACARGCDLDYLCTTNTTSGYTLGEGALRCSLSLCSMEVAMSFDTYSICDSIPGALPRTHPTIVATIVPTVNPTSTATRPTTIITAEPDTTDTRPTANPTTTKTTTRTTSTPTVVTTFQSPVSTTDSSPESTSTETEEATSTSSEPSPGATTSDTPSSSAASSGLDSGAVIGVSVASGLAGFFIIGVIIFFCCRRIRRKIAQDREFFEIGGHMAEPPDFSFPPRRPLIGPRPSPGTQNPEAEDARLVPPVEPEYQQPAVIVTEPEAEYNYEHMREANADRSGFQSSNLEFDAASSISSRTVSDLLPDKPTYELYPRPLRWSQHKKSRPSSTATYFEEDNPPAQRNLPSPSLQHFVFTGSTEQSNGRPPMAGLPANPRAMMYGFGQQKHNQIPNTMGPEYGKQPVYASAKENIPPSRQAAVHGSSSSSSGASSYQQQLPAHIEYDDNIDNYWLGPNAGFVGARVSQPQQPQPSQPPSRNSFHSAGANRNSFSDDYSGYDFESLDYDGSGTGAGLGLGTSRRASRHSGSFRPLTPVREIRTPTGEAQKSLGNPFKTPSKPSRYRQPGPSSLSTPYTQPGPAQTPQEIISRPRIVRQDDIKRVQIRRGKPSSKEVTVPYCPDDYWLEPQNSEPQARRQTQAQHQPLPQPPPFGGASSGGREGPWGYITPRQSSDYSNKYAPRPPPGPANMGPLGMPKKKPAPMERNLTPKRRGEDLILQVD